jgi:hypothetical protein
MGRLKINIIIVAAITNKLEIIDTPDTICKGLYLLGSDKGADSIDRPNPLQNIRLKKFWFIIDKKNTKKLKKLQRGGIYLNRHLEKLGSGLILLKNSIYPLMLRSNCIARDKIKHPVAYQGTKLFWIATASKTIAANVCSIDNNAHPIDDIEVFG